MRYFSNQHEERKGGLHALGEYVGKFPFLGFWWGERGGVHLRDRRGFIMEMEETHGK
jgi:hypothetical protein